ncbi:ArnT family glycosyltransferase [Paenibacillus motobuensis]|uniref:Glycosyltransferase family 39 protein n=1 Tax=Paenibacillus motobuensis TaxID=295324 RepID=A0ABN0YLW3_9BACL
MFTNITHRLKRLANLKTLICIFIFATALFVRIDFVNSVEHHIPHDSLNYDIMVRQLLEKGVYAYKSEEPNAQVSPGYPLFMAGSYLLADYKNHDPYPLIRYIQIGFSMVTLWLVYLTGRRLGGEWAGIIAAAILAIYPPFVWANGAILTETLAAMLFMLYVYLQLRVFEKETALSAILAGGVLGLLVLTRPEFLILILPAYAFFWLWRKRSAHVVKLAAVSCLGIAIVLTPWIVRNMVTMHQFILTSTQVNPFAAGTYPNKNYDDNMVDRKGKTQMEVAKERLKVGFTEHTWTFVKWYTIGKTRYIYGRMFFGAGHSPVYPVIPLGNLYHRTILLGGFISTVALLRRWRQPAVLLVVLVVAISITRLAFVPEFRYNFTAMPLFIILASLLAATALDYLLGRRSNKEPLSVGEEH